MNKNLVLRLAAVVALVGSPASFAADTAEIRVTARVTPGTCDLVLTNGGAFQYGVKIASTISNSSAPASLGVLSTELTVSCQADTKIALTLIDAQAGSVLGNSGTLLGSSQISGNRFGLGVARNGGDIGAYAIGIRSDSLVVASSAGTLPGLVPVSSMDTLAWTQEASADVLFGTGKYVSWGTSAGAGPSAAQTVTATLDVEAAVGKAADLPSDYDLNGIATLEISYL